MAAGDFAATGFKAVSGTGEGGAAGAATGLVATVRALFPGVAAGAVGFTVRAWPADSAEFAVPGGALAGITAPGAGVVDVDPAAGTGAAVGTGTTASGGICVQAASTSTNGHILTISCCNGGSCGRKVQHRANYNPYV